MRPSARFGLFALATVLAATTAHAQEPVVNGWFAGLGGGLVVEDDDGITARPTAPALHGTVGYAFASRIRLTAEGWVGRRHLDVGPDRLRRTVVFLGLGGEFALVRNPGVELGVGLAIGAAMQDDASLTDPGFRSSANWLEAAVPGIVLRVPVSHRIAVSFTARDYIGGVWGALIDPSESGVNHQFGFGLGVVIR